MNVTSKTAIIGRTHTLAMEFGDDVTVNAIFPGPTKIPRLEDVIRQQAAGSDRSVKDVKQELFIDDTALESLVRAEDVAYAVTFLATPSTLSRPKILMSMPGRYGTDRPP